MVALGKLGSIQCDVDAYVTSKVNSKVKAKVATISFLNVNF
jgi:hypothetical protein